MIGALANNLWSFAGDSDRDNVNLMTVQPFVNYNFGKGWYVSSWPIITANWAAHGSDNTWTVPVGGGFGRIIRIGKLPVNLEAQAFDNVVKPDDDPTADWTLLPSGRVPVPEMRRQHAKLKQRELPVTTTATEKANPVDIQTDKGKVRCSQFETHLEGLGIPYAAPPLGDLRLRAPVEHAAWTEVRDATRFGSASLQAKTEYNKAQGSEDCLYLNVYRPGTANGAPLAVMMWLHGGGFVNGSGNAFYGAFLAQTANAIVVTVNYRLGPLGWLALASLSAEATDQSTGNYGLLDSIAALKWIKRNISAFGGDPGRVSDLWTISGR